MNLEEYLKPFQVCGYFNFDGRFKRMLENHDASVGNFYFNDIIYDNDYKDYLYLIPNLNGIEKYFGLIFHDISIVL